MRDVRYKQNIKYQMEYQNTVPLYSLQSLYLFQDSQYGKLLMAFCNTWQSPHGPLPPVTFTNQPQKPNEPVNSIVPVKNQLKWTSASQLNESQPQTVIKPKSKEYKCDTDLPCAKSTETKCDSLWQNLIDHCHFLFFAIIFVCIFQVIPKE